MWGSPAGCCPHLRPRLAMLTRSPRRGTGSLKGVVGSSARDTGWAPEVWEQNGTSGAIRGGLQGRGQDPAHLLWRLMAGPRGHQLMGPPGGALAHVLCVHPRELGGRWVGPGSHLALHTPPGRKQMPLLGLCSLCCLGLGHSVTAWRVAEMAGGVTASVPEQAVAWAAGGRGPWPPPSSSQGLGVGGAQPGCDLASGPDGHKLPPGPRPRASASCSPPLPPLNWRLVGCGHTEHFISANFYLVFERSLVGRSCLIFLY